AKIWNAMVRAGVTSPALGTFGLEVASVTGDPVQINVSANPVQAVATEPLNQTYQTRLVSNTGTRSTSGQASASFRTISSRENGR
ncbi:MAG: hypothetical protein AAFQ60_15110, partial [Pseudomonadota bacterium]